MTTLKWEREEEEERMAGTEIATFETNNLPFDDDDDAEITEEDAGEEFIDLVEGYLKSCQQFNMFEDKRNRLEEELKMLASQSQSQSMQSQMGPPEIGKKMEELNKELDKANLDFRRALRHCVEVGGVTIEVRVPQTRGENLAI